MKTIVLVTPALPQANNGNAHTAMRWTQFLRQKYHVKTVVTWDGSPAHAMIALHARRSADSINRYYQTGEPLAVVLTGTDLYRDIQTDSAAQQSLEQATQLVTLQEAGISELPKHLQSKAHYIYQSAPRRRKLKPRKTTFDLVFVGHIRPEKDPLTAVNAMAQLRLPALRLRVIGDLTQDKLGHAVAALAANDQRIQLLGPTKHQFARKEISQARLLIISSVMEGGANVIIEAITSGTAVLASRVNGNIGMLGADYQGYFTQGNAIELAQLIERAHSDLSFFDRLNTQCQERAWRFTPEQERAGVLALAESLLLKGSGPRP
jgi:putative glycosyltransferase (TIGR04348 family)